MPSSDPRFSPIEEESLPLGVEGAENWFGFSLRSLLLILVGILLFGLYVGVLLFGENSLEVLNGLREEKAQLQSEKRRLQSENQRLQKKYFELLQITGE
jgi:hypothetical protein